MNHNSLVVSCIFFEQLPTMMSVDISVFLFFRLGQFWSDFLKSDFSGTSCPMHGGTMDLYSLDSPVPC